MVHKFDTHSTCSLLCLFLCLVSLTVGIGEALVGGEGRHRIGAHFIVDDGGQAIGHTLAYTIALAHAAHPLALVDASIGIGLRAVPVLESVLPRALSEHIKLTRGQGLMAYFTFVLGATGRTTAYAVSPFEATCPFALVRPSALGLDAESTAFSLIGENDNGNRCVVILIDCFPHSTTL